MKKTKWLLIFLVLTTAAMGRIHVIDQVFSINNSPDTNIQNITEGQVLSWNKTQLIWENRNVANLTAPESDTLQTVTDRGSSTDNNITTTGNIATDSGWMTYPNPGAKSILKFSNGYMSTGTFPALYPDQDNVVNLGLLYGPGLTPYRFKNGRFSDTVYATSFKGETLSLSSNLITDSTGSISFDNENIITTGDVTADNIVGNSLKVSASNNREVEIKPGNALDIKTILYADRWVMQNLREDGSGGWARNIMEFQDENEDRYFTIGAFGNGQDVRYGYIGVAYNDAVIKLSTPNTDDAENRVGINLGSSTRPAYTLDVGGDIKAESYKSSDGSEGWTGSFTNGDGDTVTIKNGLITNVN
ncbi:MAG: hypothetical protein ACOC80_00665 [Petrotogales bacterium]